MAIQVPIFLAIVTVLSNIGAWIVEFFIQYGRKVAFFLVAVGFFYSSLYVISTSVLSILDVLNVAGATSAISGNSVILTAIYPSNFIAVFNLVLATEFQILFWRWANKVIDLKVDFFS
ncbi:MAG: hypothetical protein OEY96_06995 [Gammaproteobacteria bacterium]|nr:hypothetical protein [Gammaproteobacteria bacterium]